MITRPRPGEATRPRDAGRPAPHMTTMTMSISPEGPTPRKPGGARRLPALVLGLLLASAAPAFAACSDPASAGVDWRRCRLDGLSFANADLKDADLRNGSFRRSDFGGADLTGARARSAKFIEGNLADAVLDRTELTRADLTASDLAGASLRGAGLRSARLFRANLRGADLTGAVLDDADLFLADLGGATWTDGRTVCAEGSVGRCEAGDRRTASPRPTTQ